jgi:hypothetical protein
VKAPGTNPDATHRQPEDTPGEQATLDAYLENEVSRRRDTGFDHAAQADPDAFDEVCRQILKAADELGTFSTDDLNLPARGNEVGAAFSRLRQSGAIEPVGYRTSRRPRSHGRLVRVWRAA